jgi:molybdenum cofactor cytidylyltransferase
MISLTKAFRLGPAPQVAFVGAGGKTSAIFTLAREYKAALVTTSTHLSVTQAHSGDAHIEIDFVADIEALGPTNLNGVVVFSGTAANDRVAGLNAEQLAALSAFARRHQLPLLIEADGARERSLKAPAAHEPAIPPFVDTVIVVAGLGALGKPLDPAYIHRSEVFAELAGLAPGAPVDAGAVTRVLLHPNGGLKNIPTGARKLVLLNQADTPEFASAAKTLADELLPAFDAVIVSALKQATAASAVYERTAGILLAAGGSQRLGSAKQLLDWKGKPFVRQVAETALAAGLDPLIVVTGSNPEDVEASITGLNVQVVRNRDWQSGQSSSVKAGLAALPQSVGSALFLVVDQPQLPIALVEALLAEHTATLAPIVAPLVDGQRSNPVLFDRATFADFAALEGDVGGRAIFAKHQVTWLPWLDASLSIDVDFPEDYDRLLRQAG